MAASMHHITKKCLDEYGPITRSQELRCRVKVGPAWTGSLSLGYSVDFNP